MEIIDCPSCGAPAEVERAAVFGSTSGPVEHVRTYCVRRHAYLLPRDALAG